MDFYFVGARGEECVQVVVFIVVAAYTWFVRVIKALELCEAGSIVKGGLYTRQPECNRNAS